MKNNLNLKGKFNVTCVDKDGNEKWSQEFNNGIVDEGVAYLLDAGFNEGAIITTWYIGLIKDYTAFDNADDMAGIGTTNDWGEYQHYDEANRQEWTAGNTASRSMTNATTADFTISSAETATGTINGIFITSDNTIGGTSGTLWSTANFSSNASVVTGDTLKVTYTING